MKLGTSPVTVADLAKSQEDCVLGILPAALYTDLKKNIPAAVLVGQAIQETGWCKSELAHKAGNLHGQKASFDAKHFTHWDGESYSHLSSEDPEGQGKNIQRSSFMKFTHFEFSFFSAAERFSLPGSPYTQCLTEKSRDLDFLNCIGKIWAVDQNYAQDVAKHFAFQSKTLGFTLRNCGINHMPFLSLVFVHLFIMATRVSAVYFSLNRPWVCLVAFVFSLTFLSSSFGFYYLISPLWLMKRVIAQRAHRLGNPYCLSWLA